MITYSLPFGLEDSLSFQFLRPFRRYRDKSPKFSYPRPPSDESSDLGPGFRPKRTVIDTLETESLRVKRVDSLPPLLPTPLLVHFLSVPRESGHGPRIIYKLFTIIVKRQTFLWRCR